MSWWSAIRLTSNAQNRENVVIAWVRECEPTSSVITVYFLHHLLCLLTVYQAKHLQQRQHIRDWQSTFAQIANNNSDINTTLTIGKLSEGGILVIKDDWLSKMQSVWNFRSMLLTPAVKWSVASVTTSACLCMVYVRVCVSALWKEKGLSYQHQI